MISKLSGQYIWLNGSYDSNHNIRNKGKRLHLTNCIVPNQASKYYNVKVLVILSLSISKQNISYLLLQSNLLIQYPFLLFNYSHI